MHHIIHKHNQKAEQLDIITSPSSTMKTSTMEQSWSSQILLSPWWTKLQRQKLQHYSKIAKQPYRWESPWRRWDITNPKNPLPQITQHHRASSPKPWYQNIQNHMIQDSDSWNAEKLKNNFILFGGEGRTTGRTITTGATQLSTTLKKGVSM